LESSQQRIIKNELRRLFCSVFTDLINSTINDTLGLLAWQ